MDWPGFDEPPPVVLNAGRPGRNRPRWNTEHLGQQQVYYAGPNGQLLVPAAGAGGAGRLGGVHRSASVSGQRPTVIINNDNCMSGDNLAGNRPLSAYGRYEDDYVWDYERGRPRSSSRVRASTPANYEPDPETKQKLKELDELKQKQKDKERQKKLEDELFLKRKKEEEEAAQKAAEEKALKKKAVEEWKLKEEEEKLKKKKEKEKADEEFKERMRKTLWANGYSDEQIERMMKKADKKESHGGGESSSTTVLALSRPTYIKVHRRHLDPDTLDVYQLPWEWDDVSGSFQDSRN